MSAWKAEELAVLEQYLDHHQNPLTNADYEELHQRLQGKRSVAGIKKKAIELRRARAGYVRPRNRAPEAWTLEEQQRLVDRYRETQGPSKRARITAIAGEFPGRTVKGLEKRLRDLHPDVYYGEYVGPVINEHEDQLGRAQDAPPLPNLPEQLQLSDEGGEGEDEPRERELPVDRLIDTPQQVRQQQQLRPPPPPPSHLGTSRLSREFRREWRAAGFKRPRIKRIPDRVRGDVSLRIDNLLDSAIQQVEASQASENNKRTKIKQAIYAAGAMLVSEMRVRGEKKPPPTFVLTQRLVTKLQRRVKRASELREWRGGRLKRELKNEARELRKLRMTPTQYIKITEDRIRMLQNKAEVQRAKADAVGLRRRFDLKPSRAIITPREEKATPDPQRTETYFRELYKEHQDRRPTPQFNDWIHKMTRHRSSLNLESQLQQANINRKIDESLRRASPWKAPGEDAIPTAIYKLLPAAKRYLIQFLSGVLTGKSKLHEEDVRARVTLLHKAGEEEDPENYRPIAGLNADYKILTSTITSLIKDGLADWMVPKEQLARAGVWGTVQGLLWDKAVTQVARMSKAAHCSVWFDFKKAYDSVHHHQLRRLIEALPIHREARRCIKAMMKMWAIVVEVGNKKTSPIYVRRGVFQGDTMSSLLFILLTAFITTNIKSDVRLLRAAKGKLELAAYMDDYKIHVPTEEAAELATEVLREAAREVGLSLNVRKCGIYNNRQQPTEEDDVEEEIPFLPRIRTAYKYLGLHQRERDTALNAEALQDRVLVGTAEILDSKLSPSQKIRLFNTTVLPAAVYVMGNMYPDESRPSTLKRCAGMDKKIRRILVEKGLQGRSVTRVSVYTPVDSGGLGLKSIALETEVQYVRKYLYLQQHPEMAKTNTRYTRLNRKGWRNPISDGQHVLEKYDLEVPARLEGEEVNDFCRRTTRKLVTKQRERLIDEWSYATHYGRLIKKEAGATTFPAMRSAENEDWLVTYMHEAAEEQIQGLNNYPAGRRRCRAGCAAEETAYHVSTACVTPAYTARHDYVVHWLLKAIMSATGAPEELRAQLPFGKAAILVEYTWGARDIGVKAGMKFPTDPALHHNRPDIVVTLTQPKEIFILEVAVSHLQNIRLQEKIKRVRYAKNSVATVDDKNVDTVRADYNLVEVLRQQHRCPVHLGVLVIGAFGEIVITPEHLAVMRLLRGLGIAHTRASTLLQKCAMSVAKGTAKIIMARTGTARDDQREEGGIRSGAMFI